MARSPHARLAAGVLALTVAGIAACSPITTTTRYAPSDGVRFDLPSDPGRVTGENVLVVTEGEGEPGQVHGALTNRTNEARSVAVSLDAEPLTVIRLSPGETVTIGSEAGPQIELPAVPVRPGALAEFGFATDEDGSITVRVPVLDGTLPEYAELLEPAE